MKRWFIIPAFLLISFIAWKVIDQYLLCPRYVFADPIPFRGYSIYNPYELSNLDKAAICNFHAHVQTNFGLTNGQGDGFDVQRRYDSMGYDFHAISQYQMIDTFGRKGKKFLPVYEHGYNINKTHQLIIGANHVNWKDYIFPQTIHNKQQILLELSKDTGNIIVLNHPSLRNGYSKEDLQFLQYYDYIELLNPAAQSFSHWDALLSAGKRVYAMGNDDLHNIFNNNQLGRFLTLVYDADSGRSTLIHALRRGASIAVWLPQIDDESLSDKIKKLEGIGHKIKSIQSNNDSFSILLRYPFKEIRVITDNGLVKQISNNTQNLSGRFLPEESYWRLELIDTTGIRFFLNPFYRQIHGQLLSRNEMGLKAVTMDRKPVFAFMLLFGSIFATLCIVLKNGWLILYKWLKKHNRRFPTQFDLQ